MRKQFAVCPTCDGNGTHVNPSIDAHGLSREDFDGDPDFEESYFAGDYDVSCAECGGQRVVAKCAKDGCSQPAYAKERSDGWTDRRDRVTTSHYATCYAHMSKDARQELEDHWEYLAEVQAERRVGA